MNGNNEASILDYIIEITEQKDAELLEVSLATTLYDLYRAERVLFCKVRDENHDIFSVIQVDAEGFYTDLGTEDIEKIGNELGRSIASLIESNALIEDDTGDLHVVMHPVRLFKRIIGFVAVYLKRETLVDSAVIEGLLKIYHNYITLLTDNQRDRLTGLLNRKTFDDRIMKIIEFKKTHEKNAEPEQSRRHRVDESFGFWLGIVDIDNFKAINDTFGHVYGDEVLILVSRIMTRAFRSDDLLFRYGGEEFVVIIRSREEHDAFHAFDRFREETAAYRFPQVGHITLSVGMVQITSREVPTAFVGHADQALYYAKTHGKNRVCVYEKLAAEGLLKTGVKYGKVELF